MIPEPWAFALLALAALRCWWLLAEDHPTKGYQRRPGWHAAPERFALGGDPVLLFLPMDIQAKDLNEFRERNLKVTITTFQKNDDAITAYDSGRCDAYTAGFGALAGQRIKLKNPDDHVILNELISNDPQGPVTRYGDERWQAVVCHHVEELLEGDLVFL